ncbi:hypothetical protein [uncultured Microbacterium sp.]|uniref:hypothetical protein n=1 Tax=uncultured Microbacterium sp. TaxID=191216 RepID=UPI0028DB13D2|nr:hypothetical protein [uncultured Microbacterium sp.]
MSEHTDIESGRGEDGPSIGRVVAFVVCAIVPVVVAVPMTILGRFLGYAGLVTTQSDAVFVLFLSIASGGPSVLALVSIVWGAQRLISERAAPFAIPLLGALAMPVLYFVCAMVLAS